MKKHKLLIAVITFGLTWIAIVGQRMNQSSNN